ncbi:UDP-glucose 4-epimerase GalE [Micrococcus terreus]|uniref:UDP-glucose 4-epimerase GalE n=1 Tax=Micrococcus terreus TaxID=574650 RepID=UPI003D73BEC5
MTWLVTGGAGYIGSHVVQAFLEAGLPVVVVDDLSTGHRSFVPAEVPFIQADINDTPVLTGTLREHEVAGIVHVAGFKYAGVSVQEPLQTYRANVSGTVSVLQAARDAGVPNLVFSSSAATYGTPQTETVTEDTATGPESPYGESKLIGEWLIADEARATGLRHTSLRYFNVVGSGYPHLVDTSPHNLFPLVFDAILDGRQPTIFGDDYPTPDGTCVRDYIHVSDLAVSHVSAARRLQAGEELAPVYNLGSGDGTSVRQIMDAMAAVTGRDVAPQIKDRRPGDPPRIVAEGALAARDIDWAMRHSLEQMVESAWTARQRWQDRAQD